MHLSDVSFLFDVSIESNCIAEFGKFWNFWSMSNEIMVRNWEAFFWYISFFVLVDILLRLIGLWDVAEFWTSVYIMIKFVLCYQVIRKFYYRVDNITCRLYHKLTFSSSSSLFSFLFFIFVKLHVKLTGLLCSQKSCFNVFYCFYIFGS